MLPLVPGLRITQMTTSLNPRVYSQKPLLQDRPHGAHVTYLAKTPRISPWPSTLCIFLSLMSKHQKTMTSSPPSPLPQPPREAQVGLQGWACEHRRTWGGTEEAWGIQGEMHTGSSEISKHMLHIHLVLGLFLCFSKREKFFLPPPYSLWHFNSELKKQPWYHL